MTPPPPIFWACETSGQPSEGLTVGAAFTLTCTGPEVAELDAKTLSLELPKPDRYRLRILENKKTSPSAVELVVTSYTAGETALRDVILTDGIHRIALQGINFQVSSVLKQGEEPKPFPPETPVELSWPLAVYVVMIAVVLSTVMTTALFFKARRRKRKFEAWLHAERTPLSAFDQLSKDLRRAVKERDPVKHIADLETITRRYLSFEFRSPLMSASPRVILKTIAGPDRKRRARLAPLTIRLFGEFTRIAESLATAKLSGAEALNIVLPQIHELIREFAEKLKTEQSAAVKRRR